MARRRTWRVPVEPRSSAGPGDAGPARAGRASRGRAGRWRRAAAERSGAALIQYGLIRQCNRQADGHADRRIAPDWARTRRGSCCAKRREPNRWPLRPEANAGCAVPPVFSA